MKAMKTMNVMNVTSTVVWAGVWRALVVAAAIASVTIL